jgi:hypothetical protein
MLEPELLEKARAAGAAFEAAERDALLARANYHTAIRRLHLAGASLREIATALSLSHQRVQQIVNKAGGSWWRGAWKTRRGTPDAVCTWCSRPPAEVARLIAGPHVYICDSCVDAAEQVAAGGSSTEAFGRTSARAAAGRCAFCSQRGGPDRPVVTGTGGHVCVECLRTCREILGGRLSGGPAAPGRG